MARPKPKQKIVPVTIRFPADLHAMLKDAAEGDSPQTPFNTLVVSLLYDAMKPKDAAELDVRYEAAADAFMRTIREMQKRIAELEAERGKQ